MHFAFIKTRLVLFTVLVPICCAIASHASERSVQGNAPKPGALPHDARIHRVVYSLAQLAAPLASLAPSMVSSDISHGNSTGAVLQIGAFQNEDGAHAASKEFHSRHGDVHGLTTSIKKIDLGAKGIWYRVRLGPFADSAVAKTACTELKVHGTDCIVTPAP